MGRKKVEQASGSSEAAPRLPFVAHKGDVDPTLDSLFTSSVGMN